MLEVFGLNRHNELWLNDILFVVVMPVVGVACALLTWVRYERKTRDAQSGGKPYLYRQTDRHRWIALGMAMAVAQASAVTTLSWYLAPVVIDIWGSTPVKLYGEVIEVKKASVRSVTNCVAYTVLRIETGKVSKICTKRWIGETTVWPFDREPSVGDRVAISARVSVIGSIADHMEPVQRENVAASM